MTLGESLAIAGPFYNLALVSVALFLFAILFRTQPKFRVTNLFPWKLIFGAVLIFVIEEIITILRAAKIITIPVHINGFFELAIIILVIYAMLLQKEHIEKRYSGRKMRFIKKSTKKKSKKVSRKK